MTLLLLPICRKRLMHLLLHGSHLLVDLLHMPQQALLVPQPILAPPVHRLLSLLDNLGVVLVDAADLLRDKELLELVAEAELAL